MEDVRKKNWRYVFKYKNDFKRQENLHRTMIAYPILKKFSSCVITQRTKGVIIFSCYERAQERNLQNNALYRR